MSTDVTITVNDERRTLPPGSTCRQLVEQLTGREVDPLGRPREGAGLGIALAVDGALVPRAEWNDTLLRADQRVEVVTAVQGG
ncbi:sulfur carrier protein [Kineosphaera limosa]|uniref:Thiamine biosynthesis protein ThiS n=1 Tax=Kineosphaera limosa NBRC 100340 TaxID=1184609 RepID=K6VLM4_9MICO|nr:sulfur carrier protein ThiS [Kineosphaera limosa]NYE00325.1 sulfur carrier protein [Kineosphaera limosa]GAB97123.1 thiamine biosynthesis protein ThiS [Kineosphaera limosa NBRC 100340]